ncbi:MAG: hypothetical protein KDD62_00160 [Bdellovibrionales bacterium]|nr:hypothetical protein [Bdellovibrionales bacterium]
MPRKNEYGKYIFAAGEVSSFVICPEAWRLNYMEQVDKIIVPQVKEGDVLHKQWSDDIKDAAYFTRCIRQLVLLMIVTVALFAVRFFSH